MPTSSSCFSHRERGFILLTGALCCTALLCFLGLAIDAGYMETQKLRIQSAADAAAAGAALTQSQGGNSSAITTEGKWDSSLNGFTDGSNSVTVTINNPPTTGFYTTNNNYVEAIVSQNAPTYFMKILGINTVTIKARAVAKGGSTSTSCIYALDSSVNKAVWITGSGTDNICGIKDNSTGNPSMTTTGSECLITNFIGVQNTSNTSLGSSCATVNGAGSSVSATQISAFTDPLASVAPPSVAINPVCDHINYSTSSSATISQGIYCGGISVTGTANLTFNAGTYILFGGGLNRTGGGNLTGTGVTFYFTAGKASNNTTYSYAGLNTSGSGTYTLTAPTSGTLQGWLFMQDRSQSGLSGTAPQNSINGSSSSAITGIVYFPSYPITWTGSNTSSAPYTIVIGDTVKITGTVSFSDDFSTLGNGNPIPSSGGGITFGE